MAIANTGYWTTTDGKEHIHDASLAFSLVKFANMHRLSTIADFGCGLGNYAFIHEDQSRSFNIKRKYVDSKLNIIKSNPNLKQFSIFDYRKVLENASEIHCIEGSFSALVESINLNSSLYAHRYARPEVLRDPWHAYKYKCEWQVITELN